MSEPCSFTALIHMTPEAFAALMRSKTLDPLAGAIAGIVTDGLSDVVVFKYLKKEQALVAHYYFYYPEALEDILEQPGVSALLAASQFKDVDAADRAVISHDANNFKESEPSAGFLIEQGQFGREDSFDAQTIDAFERLLDQHFFKFAEGLSGAGGQWVQNSRIIDTKLRRKVERKLEERQLLIAKEQIPSATPLRPVRLFDKFHYNGHFVLWTQPKPPLPLIGIDPQTLRQTAYGAVDADHVMAGGVVLPTDPARFKALRKGDTTFYVSAERVYNARMEPVSDVEPKTFKLVHGAFARDRDRWYTHSGTPLEDVGDSARIDDSLYHYSLTLLMGEHAVYLGDRRLAVHASSCRVVRTRALQKDPFYGGLLWLADDEGDCIVSCVGRFGQEFSLNVQRTNGPEADWSKEEASWEALVATAAPIDVLRRETKRAKDDPGAAHDFAAFFEDWLSQYLDAQWREDPYNSFFWEGVDRYFEMLLRSGEHERLLEFYRGVEIEAWFWPQIFHHTALACLALDKTESAVEQIRRAVIYSYSSPTKLFEKPQVAALLEREDVTGLKAFAEYLDSLPGLESLLPGELARHWLDAIPDRHKLKAVQRIFSHFRIPDCVFLRSMRSNDAEKADLYEQSLVRFMNVCTLDATTRRFPAYNARKNYTVWGELPGLHPAVHLIAASSLYSEGFFWMDMRTDVLPRAEFGQAEIALRRATALGTDAKWADDPDWKQLAGDPAFAPLLELVGTSPRDAAAGEATASE